MKKAICITLSIATVLSLCACGAKETSVSSSVDEIVTSVEAPVVEEPIVEEPVVEEVVVEEPIVEEPVVEEKTYQFADKLHFCQVGVPETIRICEYNKNEDGSRMANSDACFASEFVLENLNATETEDGEIIYDFAVHFDLENWDLEHDFWIVHYKVFDLENECEFSTKEEGCPVSLDVDSNIVGEEYCDINLKVIAPKDYHVGFYLCAGINTDDYPIEKYEGMGKEISWAIQKNISAAFIDLNSALEQ